MTTCNVKGVAISDEPTEKLSSVPLCSIAFWSLFVYCCGFTDLLFRFTLTALTSFVLLATVGCF